VPVLSWIGEPTPLPQSRQAEALGFVADDIECEVSAEPG
jgi:hypothetical protein